MTCQHERRGSGMQAEPPITSARKKHKVMEKRKDGTAMRRGEDGDYAQKGKGAQRT